MKTLNLHKDLDYKLFDCYGFFPKHKITSWTNMAVESKKKRGGPLKLNVFYFYKNHKFVVMSLFMRDTFLYRHELV